MRRPSRNSNLGSLAPLVPLVVGITVAASLMVSAAEGNQVETKPVNTERVESSTNRGVERAPITNWQEAHTVVFTFESESDRLSEIDREQLRAAVQSANAVGVVRGAAVAAWSDSSYPESPRAMLPRAERALAERRADAVATELRRLDVAAIDVFNMAEHASWFSRAFKTADARVKGLPDSEGGRQSAKDLELEALGDLIREKGGPAKAVVALRTETTPASPVAH